MLPIPAPATALLLNGVPNFPGDIAGEMCTPTGVLLIKSLAESFVSKPEFSVSPAGCGFGGEDYVELSCVRVGVGEGVAVA